MKIVIDNKIPYIRGGIDKLTFQTERKAVGSDVRLLPHFSKTQKLAV
jgi:hypothetical protein